MKKEKSKNKNLLSKSSRILSLHLLVFFIGATLILLLSPQQVSSLGVAPSLFNLDNPKNVVNLRLRILNTQHEDLFVNIKPEGPLADYVDLDKTTYRLKPTESEKIIYYKLSIPNSLSPGQNVLNMYVLQLDEAVQGKINENAQLNAKVSVVQRVNVNIPYPGKYLTGNLFVQATQTKSPIKFIVHAINKGDEDVNFNGKITIRGPTNQILATVVIPPSKVLASNDNKINLELAGLTNAGEYTAEAHLQYGDKQTTFKKSFSVGSMQADAYEMKIERFRLGEIVKVAVGVSSQWNKQIDDLYVEGKVIDDSGVVVSTFTSNKISIPAQGLSELEAFWDTANLAPGVYDFDLQLHYDNKVTENYFKGGLSLNQATFKKRGLTGNIISSSKKDSSSSDLGGLIQTTNLLVFLVIILIIIVAVLLIMMKKNNKK